MAEEFMLLNYFDGTGGVGGWVGWVTIEIIMPLCGPTVGKTLGLVELGQQGRVSQQAGSALGQAH